MSTTVTIATVTSYNEYYNALSEHKIWFHRPYRLSMRGVERMLKFGCDETEDEPRPDLSVTRIEYMVYA